MSKMKTIKLTKQESQFIYTLVTKFEMYEVSVIKDVLSIIDIMHPQTLQYENDAKVLVDKMRTLQWMIKEVIKSNNDPKNKNKKKWDTSQFESDLKVIEDEYMNLSRQEVEFQIEGDLLTFLTSNLEDVIREATDYKWSPELKALVTVPAIRVIYNKILSI